MLFSRSYCGRSLQWHLVGDACDTTAAPDVVFDDPSFSPLTQATNSVHHADLVALLDKWQPHSLQQLLQLLLQQYKEHQKARIAALNDDRILFELSMLDELGCTEVLLAPASDGSDAQQACFSIPLQADLSPAQQLLSCLNQTQQNQQQAHIQPHHHHHQQQQQQQEEEFVLHVAFRVSSSGSVSAAPSLQLQSPPWCSQLLPALTLAAWDPQTSLLEYVPHLAERLTQHLKDHCPPVQLRFQLITALSELLGTPWEVNMMASSSSPSGIGSSAAAASTAAAKRSRSCSVAVWQLSHDAAPLLLRLELSQAFPGDPPLLALQNVRRSGPDSIVTLQNMPWSPRWPVDEMVARLFNFLKQQEVEVAREQQLG